MTVTANVARSADEAEIQERTGEAVIKTDQEEAEPNLLAEALAEDEEAEANEGEATVTEIAGTEPDAGEETDASKYADEETNAGNSKNTVDEKEGRES